MSKNSPIRRTPALKSKPAVTPSPVSVVAAAAAPVATPVIAPVAMPVAASVVAPVAKTAPAVEAVRPLPTALIADLRNASVETAVDAAAKLGETGDVRVVASLVSVLANADGFCHTVTRAAAAMALGKFDTAESRKALLASATDAMAEVSREAVLALGTLKATEAAATLIEIAANGSGFYISPVRLAAVRSLGKMKAAAAKSTLATIAASTMDDAALVAAARDAMGQL